MTDTSPVIRKRHPFGVRSRDGKAWEACSSGDLRRAFFGTACNEKLIVARIIAGEQLVSPGGWLYRRALP